jgi:hypothetical protein
LSTASSCSAGRLAWSKVVKALSSGARMVMAARASRSVSRPLWLRRERKMSVPRKGRVVERCSGRVMMLVGVSWVVFLRWVVRSGRGWESVGGEWRGVELTRQSGG